MCERLIKLLDQNSLTLETWDQWETPAHIMQYTRFKDVLKNKKAPYPGAFIVSQLLKFYRLQSDKRL